MLSQFMRVHAQTNTANSLMVDCTGETAEAVLTAVLAGLRNGSLNADGPHDAAIRSALAKEAILQKERTKDETGRPIARRQTRWEIRPCQKWGLRR